MILWKLKQLENRVAQDVIKIDVEGAESEVWRGAKKSIR